MDSLPGTWGIGNCRLARAPQRGSHPTWRNSRARQMGGRAGRPAGSACAGLKFARTMEQSNAGWMAAVEAKGSRSLCTTRATEPRPPPPSQTASARDLSGPPNPTTHGQSTNPSRPEPAWARVTGRTLGRIPAIPLELVSLGSWELPIYSSYVYNIYGELQWRHLGKAATVL